MKNNSVESFFIRNWYGNSRWVFLLLPLNWIFVLLSGWRRWWLTKFKQRIPATPVIIVGNISVGGTGKTPLLVALVKKLQQEDFAPGVVSRGYGGSAASYPHLVTKSSSAQEAGDEPLSIYNQTRCPIAIGPNRFESINLLREHQVTTVLSDDGLQDYKLGRHLEIAVIDGQRWFGNAWRLPLGPLRESVSRLSSVDMVVVNNPSANAPIENFHSMTIVPRHWVNIKTNQIIPLNQIEKSIFHAVAGIGNPQRFYDSLNQLNIDFIGHDFPDHHNYCEKDFEFAENHPILMTEKDAVKCQGFARDNWYYLAVEAELDEKFWQEFMDKVSAISIQKVNLPTKINLEGNNVK